MRALRLLLVLALALAVVPVGLSAEEHPPPACDDPERDPEERCVDDVTLWLGGSEQIGELEFELGGDGFPMDRTEPTEEDPKSFQLVNYVAGPNINCEGNSLLPTWGTFMRGTVQGDVTVTLHAVAGAATEVVVNLYPDPNGGCNEEHRGPVAAQTVELDPGMSETQVVFEDLEFDVNFGLTLMLHANQGTGGVPGNATNQARLFYDAVDFDSRVEFDCLAFEGRDSCNF